MPTPKVLYRSELQKALNYHLVIINQNVINTFTEDNLKEIVDIILKRKKLYDKYKPLIKNYIIDFPLPIDLRFTLFQQVKYAIVLTDNTLHDNLILDLRVRKPKNIFC